MNGQKLLLNVREAAEAVGDTERAFRHKLFRAEQNGLDRCIVRLGRAVRIDPEQLKEWVESLPRGGEPFQYNWTKQPGRPPQRADNAQRTAESTKRSARHSAAGERASTSDPGQEASR